MNEITWVHRCLIVPDSIVEQVRNIADSLGPAAQGMFRTPLSFTGDLPATHWVSTGFIDKIFADMLSSPETLAIGVNITVEQAEEILKVCDVSEDEAFAVFERLGLKLAVDQAESI